MRPIVGDIVTQPSGEIVDKRLPIKKCDYKVALMCSLKYTNVHDIPTYKHYSLQY